MAGFESAHVQLTAAQRDAYLKIASPPPPRHFLLYGGSRSGKTYLLTWLTVARALKFPGSRHLIYRLRIKDSINSIWMETLPNVLKQFKVWQYCKPNSQRSMVVLPGGSEIWVSGVDDARFTDSVLGKEYATTYANEASQLPYATVLKVRTRLAQRVEGCMAREFVDLNPVGVGHWTYREFVEGIDPIASKPGKPVPIPNHRERYGHMQINPVSNSQNLDSNYLESLAALPDSMKRRFYLGEYARDNDLVVFHPPVSGLYAYSDFEDWARAERGNVRLSAGLDLGFQDADAFSIVAWHPRQKIRWLIYEYKMRRTGLAELALAIKAGLDWAKAEFDRLGIPQQTISVWSDTGGGGAKMVYDLRREYGLPVRPAYKRDKLSSIELLQDEVREGRFKIPAGGAFATECDAIVWTRDPDSDLVIREIDDKAYHPDMMDSILYAMRNVWYAQKPGGD